MNRINYLRDQANRAERLKNAVTDPLTIERLLAFADDCRLQMRSLAEMPQEESAKAEELT